MPEMPVKAAGWRIDPPVSVPVAAGASRADTAAELPPDVVLLPLALFGVLGLATVVLIPESAEVVVILNGLRAARTRTPRLES